MVRLDIYTHVFVVSKGMIVACRNTVPSYHENIVYCVHMN